MSDQPAGAPRPDDDTDATRTPAPPHLPTAVDALTAEQREQLDADAAAARAAIANADEGMSFLARVSYLEEGKPDVDVKIGLVEFSLIKRIHNIDIAGMMGGGVAGMDPDAMLLMVFESMKRRSMLPTEITFDTLHTVIDEVEFDDVGEAPAATS